jgi:hypothetical protein
VRAVETAGVKGHTSVVIERDRARAAILAVPTSGNLSTHLLIFQEKPNLFVYEFS